MQILVELGNQLTINICIYTNTTTELQSEDEYSQFSSWLLVRVVPTTGLTMITIRKIAEADCMNHFY